MSKSASDLELQRKPSRMQSRSRYRQVSVQGHQSYYEGWLIDISAASLTAVIEKEDGLIQVVILTGTTLRFIS